MDWQQPAAMAVVVLAAFLLVRREIRARRRARLRACGGDCSCSSPAQWKEAAPAPPTANDLIPFNPTKE